MKLKNLKFCRPRREVANLANGLQRDYKAIRKEQQITGSTEVALDLRLTSTKLQIGVLVGIAGRPPGRNR